MHHTNSFSILWGPLYGLEARLPPLNWLVHSANVPDKDDDYNDKADPPDTLIDGSKDEGQFNTNLSALATVQLPPVADHVSDDEPFKCGQEPTSILHPSIGSEELCSDEGVELWGFVDGKCKMFLEGTGCGAKLAGFDSKDECQRSCKGQDYQAPPMAVCTEATPVSN